MRKITLTRNGQTHAMDVEVSTMHADGLKTGDRVLLRIKGDCCYNKPSEYQEYKVDSVTKSDRFDGKCSDIRFVRVEKTPSAAPVATSATHPTDETAANVIRALYRDVLAKQEDEFWARARLGAMLIRWEEFLGKSNAGCKSAGEGLKGWLEKNCPEIGYSAARGYKNSARMAATMLGGGAVAVAALLGESEVTQPDGEVIDVPCDVVERRDKLYKDVDSRRKLEQAYFAFMSAGVRVKPKRKPAKKVAHPDDPLSMSDSATVMWVEAMRPFEENRAAFHSAARDLKPDVAARFLAELKMLVGALEKAGGDR